MKAVLITGLNQIEIRNMPDPVVQEGGVLVEMKNAAVCGTDVKMIKHGHRDLILPRIPGHEGTGVVFESRNQRFRNGDMVAVYPGIFCGRCQNCLSGHTARCRSIKIYGFNSDGLFRSLVPFSLNELPGLVRMSSNKNNTLSALAEPLACCISAFKKVTVERGEALIVGAGSAGSIFAALLKAKGWKRVVIADMNKKRLENNIPEDVETIETDASSIELSLNRNDCFDLIVPCCPEGLNWSFWKYLKPGGAAILFSGNNNFIKQRPVDLNEMHYREIVLAGSYGCNMNDFVSAVEMIEKIGIDLSFLNPLRISIDELKGAVEGTINSSVKKIIIDRF